MINYEAILLDCDGTIINSEPLWDRGLEEFLQQHSTTTRQDDLKPRIAGKSLYETTQIIKEMMKIENNTEELIQERKKIIARLFATELTFIEGFEQFYEKVKNHHQLAVATSLSPDLLAIADEKLHLKDLFEKHIYSVESLQLASKPAPDIFLYAADKLRVNPKECLVIEDSPIGIEAAKKAGMDCAALTTTFNESYLKEATFLIKSYANIIDSKLIQ